MLQQHLTLKPFITLHQTVKIPNGGFISQGFMFQVVTDSCQVKRSKAAVSEVHTTATMPETLTILLLPSGEFWFSAYLYACTAFIPSVTRKKDNSIVHNQHYLVIMCSCWLIQRSSHKNATGSDESWANKFSNNSSWCCTRTRLYTCTHAFALFSHRRVKPVNSGRSHY